MVGPDPLVTGDRPVYLRLPGATPAEIGTGYYLAAAGDDLLLMLRFNGHIQAFRAGTRPARLYDRMAQGEVPGGLELNGVIYELQFGALIATDSSGDSRTISSCGTRYGAPRRFAASLPFEKAQKPQRK